MPANVGGMYQKNTVKLKYYDNGIFIAVNMYEGIWTHSYLNPAIADGILTST